jgi:hypothetical protein
MTKRRRRKKKVRISLVKTENHRVVFTAGASSSITKLCRKRKRDKSYYCSLYTLKKIVDCTAFVALGETLENSHQRVLTNGSRKAAGILHTLPLMRGSVAGGPPTAPASQMSFVAAEFGG